MSQELIDRLNAQIAETQPGYKFPSSAVMRALLQDAADLIESQAAALKTAEDLIAKRDAEIAKLQTICGAAYQMAGSAGAPVRFLDVLSDPMAATDADIDALLPVGLEEFDKDVWNWSKDGV